MCGILEQLTVHHADHAELPVIERLTRRWRRLALGLDQPGIEDVIRRLGVPRLGPIDDLVQARLGHDELEHGPLVAVAALREEGPTLGRLLVDRLKGARSTT